MINWDSIQTVFLDMDGTLLDLHYDNHFWLAHVPQRYAEQHGMDPESAHADLAVRYQRVVGTMQWYCVDYWTREKKSGETSGASSVCRPTTITVPGFLKTWEI